MKKEIKSILQTTIFGEYKKPEDRVTAALLHVIQIGGDLVIQKLFGDIFDIPSNEITVVPHSNQGDSIPDGELSCECNYHIYIESKIVPNAINTKQVTEHKKLSNPAMGNYLIYLTPDTKKPDALGFVEWMSWETVIERLEDIVSCGIAYDLLKNLISQLILLVRHTIYEKKYSMSPKQSVIIVGGRWGEDVAVNYEFYACQPNRYFRDSKYIAFCHDNRIKYLFEIVEKIDSVDIRTLSSVRSTDFFTKTGYSSSPNMYFKLKLHKTFNPEIINNKTDKNGKITAFVQKQTYTTYKKIMKAKTTMDL